jgi:alkanesulfonate monooxygenase SsuD/methylene tetrahydromethanopterin reductase-like flavin-dependent oxidoreductase (luciferase family)
MTESMEFWVFLPQMRLSMPDLVARAQAAEKAGFGGMAGMDHLVPPLAESAPMYEAMVTTAWLAAHTDDLGIGSLVLCDSFRHPALVAREAVSLDHASGGRFEFGIGWGSVTSEFVTFGVGSTEPRTRVGRLKETLEIVTALWAGETVDYAGRFFQLKGARQAPLPLTRIPIVIGGVGAKTLQLVAAHADWWNLHVGVVGRLDEMRQHAGAARCSLQIQIAFVPAPSRRDEVETLARRRFGPTPLVGTAPELVEHFGALAGRGIERAYVWFTDFAPPETLAAFGEGVIRHFRDGRP